MTTNTRFEDPLLGSLNDGWQWVREAPEAWHINDNALHLRALPGTLWGERNDARNLLLRPAQPAIEGFSSEVWVTNYPLVRGEQGGIIWYVDDANYIKLVKESLEDRVWIVLAREIDDQPMLVNRIPWHGRCAHLILIYEGGRVIGRARDPEGGPLYWSWQDVGECEPLPYSGVYPGLFAHGGPEDAARWAEFTNFGAGTGR